MGNRSFEIDLLPDLDPKRIPGGETPPSTAGGTPAATEVCISTLMEAGGAPTLRRDESR